jgi:protease I
MVLSKRVAILVEDLYQDQEVWYPYYRLQEAGVDAVLVGTGKAEYKGKYGYPASPQTSADRVTAAEFDGVIVPGGFAPDLLRRSSAVLELIREANRQGKLIGAVCHAGWVLVSANVLRGKTATCFSAIKDDVVNAGATYVDREVVQDGNLITSRKPDDLPAFMRTFLAALGERPAQSSGAHHGRRQPARSATRR